MNKHAFLKFPEDKMSVLHRVALEKKGGYLRRTSNLGVEDVGAHISSTTIALRGGARASWMWGLSNYISGVFL